MKEVFSTFPIVFIAFVLVFLVSIPISYISNPHMQFIIAILSAFF